jgi:hypothetical protein
MAPRSIAFSRVVAPAPSRVTASMSARAARVKRLSLSYFAPIVPPREAKARAPPSRANPRACFTLRFHSLARKVGHPLAAAGPTSTEYFHGLRQIGFHAVHGDHLAVIQGARALLSRYPESPVPAMYGYLSSLFDPHSDSKLEFYEAIRAAAFDTTDVATFSHLLDEIAICDRPRREGILSLMIADACERGDVEVPGANLPIVLRAGINLESHPCEILARFDEIVAITDSSRRDRPYMDPVGEGFERVPFPEEATIRELIAQRRIPEAISLASSVLDQDPENKEMLEERMKLLQLADKYVDAIVDSSRLVALEPVPERKRVRGALWGILGESRKQDFEEPQPQIPARTPRMTRQAPRSRLSAKWDNKF